MIKGVDYIGVGAGGVIVNEEGKILLSRRGSKARNQVGKWESPGGSVEFGETAVETVKREAFEELGIEIKIDALLGFVDDIIVEEKQHWAGPTYLCSIVSGTPTIMEPEMCDEIGWFSVEEIETMNKTITLTHDLESYKKYISSHL
ncbi:MAG: NUDIX domain-containing protein [Patescibacteria group bacterium]